MNMLTQSRLKQMLRYERHTGAFFWRAGAGHVLAGARAGNLNSNDYWLIGVDRKRYYAHRLAWLYVHGRFPNGQLDHKNGKKTDNRIANLREASNGQNQVNSKRYSASGFRGVRKHHRKWIASLRLDGRYVYLGLFATPQAAHAAYCAAARKLHGAFFRKNFY
jgi:hypothetical protein